jgi:hypothetical protein
MAPTPGSSIGPASLRDFELQDRIGEGGSAVVYRAVNTTFQGLVALKVWRARLTQAQRDKFLRECMLQWKLSDHPNIVRLYWADAPDDEPPWLATELYQDSLANRLLADPPLTTEEAFSLADDVLAGLSAVHAESMLHRDVKPGNVLLKDGRAALADLGIAMHLEGWTRDVAAGTDAYLAPELLRGAPPTKQCDVYSAAVTIRRMFGTTVPPAVEAVLTRAASHNPLDRPEDADGLRRVLTAARHAVEATAGPVVAPGPPAAAPPLPYLEPPPLPDLSLLTVPAPVPAPDAADPDRDAADWTARDAAVTQPAAADEAFTEPEQGETEPDQAEDAAQEPDGAQEPDADLNRPDVEPAELTALTAERMVPLASPPRQRSLRPLVLGALGLLAAVIVGAVVLRSYGQQSPPVTRASTPTSSTSAPATSSAPGTPSPTAATIPAGYVKAGAPNGLTVAVPQGWRVDELRRNGLQENQAIDPAGAQGFVQFGGYTTLRSTSQLARVRGYEASRGVRAGRIRLETVPYGRADDAVRWEFTYTRNGQQRHAAGLYWRYRGTEYVVYAESPAAGWNDARQHLQVMIDTAAPH